MNTKKENIILTIITCNLLPLFIDVFFSDKGFTYSLCESLIKSFICFMIVMCIDDIRHREAVKEVENETRYEN